MTSREIADTIKGSDVFVENYYGAENLALRSREDRLVEVTAWFEDDPDSMAGIALDYDNVLIVADYLTKWLETHRQ